MSLTVNHSEWVNPEHTACTVFFSGDGFENMPYGFVPNSGDEAPIHKQLQELYDAGGFTPDEYKETTYTKEELADSVRRRRDSLLEKTDKYMTLDFPLSDEIKNQIKEYRNALRAIPEQENFPIIVEFPEMPDYLKSQEKLKDYIEYKHPLYAGEED